MTDEKNLPGAGILADTKAMIDGLKTVCANAGLANDSSEYKIITEAFLYKFLNDKFLHELRKIDRFKDSSDIEADYTAMDEDEREFELVDLPAGTAVIRPETLESETDSGIVNVSFILDVDRFQQSYRAYLAWSEDQKTWLPEDTLVECAEVQLSKYPDVLCYGMYMNSDSIELYLPYFGKIDTGEEYTVKQRYYADGGPYLEIAIDSCGDKKILDAALADVKKWLINNKLDPEKYAFEVPSHYCPGGVF